MACIKEKWVGDVEKAFGMHGARTLADREYRVNKNLPRRHTKLDPEDIVYATLTDVWPALRSPVV